MTLNPLKFSIEVNKQYLRYQLTEYRLTDPNLGEQLEKLLWRNDSPLIKGPFVSVSRAFEDGASVASLVADKTLHPRMTDIIPYPSVYKHQEQVLRAVHAGRDVLITTGTGSGKTESFLYPILNRIIRADEKNEPAGIMALIIYPMNALATDQLERMRDLLVGTGISFGMYTGETAQDREDISHEPIDVAKGTDREAYRKLVEDNKRIEGRVLHPHEERFTRDAIQRSPPRILLTNSRMLEYLLSRPEDLAFLQNAPLEFLVVDEAHTNSGALGGEVALLLRRVRALAADPAKMRHIGASATIVDPKDPKAGERFLARLFGADETNVAVVTESYEHVPWAGTPLRAQFPAHPEALFERTIAALDLDDDAKQTSEIQAIYKELTNHALPPGPDVGARLHEGLLHIDFARAIYEHGVQVAPLADQVDGCWAAAGRGPPKKLEEARWEYLTYLALGAAAQREGTPLIRPKIHVFVKGLEDAVVVFLPDKSSPSGFKPRLFLSADDALRADAKLEPRTLLPVRSCPRCGQHHYEQYVTVEDVKDRSRLGDGGLQVNGGVAYHADSTRTKARILFTDRVLQDTGEYADDEGADKHITGRFCRACGAIHTGTPTQCGSCEKGAAGDLVPIQVIDSWNGVATCPVCGYGAGYTRFRDDPFRALVENTVRNNYVLAQDMLALADADQRRLIIFADNRQDAAFQAGSMRDSSRVFRLRRLMHALVLEENAAGTPDFSVENLVDRLYEQLRANEPLARFVAPEVFEETLATNVSAKRDKALKKYLATQVLLELSRPYTDRKALESLGRVRIKYHRIHAGEDAIIGLAARHGLKPKETALWLESLLHTARRRRHFTHDLRDDLFQRGWSQRRRDLVENKYLPGTDFRPIGLQLAWADQSANKPGAIQTFIGRNSAIEIWAKAGLGLEDKDDRHEFLADAWKVLVDLGALRRVRRLEYGNERPIARTDNVYHVNGQAIEIVRSAQRWECNLCRRLHAHATPGDVCTSYRCGGRIQLVDDAAEPRDYDIVLLETERDIDAFVMAEEHTAQVPKERRQEIERRFKKGQGVNTLVATPTLELGVDIGPLDIVLMRNVPPTSANYWQRAGRAGRRHRMAVIYTYARNNAHDIHFYRTPSKLLQGQVRPPRFNLRNEVMLRKHVHASIITYFQGLPTLPEWVKKVFPARAGTMLFNAEGRLVTDVRPALGEFEAALKDMHHRAAILARLKTTFQWRWPDQPEVVADDVLAKLVDQTPAQLARAYTRVLTRLKWATRQLAELARLEAEGQVLSDENARFQKRCRQLINAYHPERFNDDKRDVAYTLKVLALEGFLPGYATTKDSVTATASDAYSPGWERFTFELNRNVTLAIREHVPGNRIYANGGKYQITNYILPPDKDVQTPIDWKIEPEKLAILRTDDISGATDTSEWLPIQSIPIADSTLSYISHVDAEETTRYRLVAPILGSIRPEHDGGSRFEFDTDARVELRRAQEIFLVNVGPASEEEYGYPICRTCGAVRSPYDDEERILSFQRTHEELHGTAPERLCLHTKVQVDGLHFAALGNIDEAASLAEALSVAASQVLDMERDDFQWIAEPSDGNRVDLFLYDSMPGGSGLLNQLLERWPEIIQAAESVATSCPGACPESCYQCLRTYYNQFWHDQLDRTAAATALVRLRTLPSAKILESTRKGAPAADDTNVWEKRLAHTVRDVWGYYGFIEQHKVPLSGCAIPYTIPDLCHPDAKMALYLDGAPHFAYEAFRKDNKIKRALQRDDWLVIRIPIGDFENPAIMERHREEIDERLKAHQDADGAP